MLLRSGGASSSEMHGTPRNSSTRRSSTTLKRSRMNRGSACFSASGVVIPSAVRRAASRRATPHRSVSSIAASSASTAASSISSKTPPVAGSFLARRFATLASVLVGAMPTETGMPVHCSTVRRSSRAWLSRRRSKPPKPRKASSIE